MKYRSLDEIETRYNDTIFIDKIKALILAIALFTFTFLGGGAAGYFLLPRPVVTETRIVERVLTNDIIIYRGESVSVNIGTNTIIDTRGDYDYQAQYSNFLNILR